MENLNFEEIKTSSSSHFAVMPDGFIYQCKTDYFQEPAIGLFRRQSIGFVQGGWEFLVARGSIKELERTEAYINKDFSVIADLIPRKDFPKKTKYGNTIIPNLEDFLESSIATNLFCAYLDKDDDFDQVPVEITKDLYDYYVNDDGAVKREKIEYVDCTLAWVANYLPTPSGTDRCEYGYAFTSENGKFYCLGKMNEHTAKYYGKGSKLKEAVKEFNKNTSYDLTKAVETAKDRELESIKKKCEKLRLSEEYAWKNAADLSLELGTVKGKSIDLEKENENLKAKINTLSDLGACMVDLGVDNLYRAHDQVRELDGKNTALKLQLKECEYISRNKTEQIEQLKIWLSEANTRELALDREVKTLKELAETNSYNWMSKAKQEKYMRNRIDYEVSKFVDALKQNIYHTLDI